MGTCQEMENSTMHHGKLEIDYQVLVHACNGSPGEAIYGTTLVNHLSIIIIELGSVWNNISRRLRRPFSTPLDLK